MLSERLLNPVNTSWTDADSYTQHTPISFHWHGTQPSEHLLDWRRQLHTTHSNQLPLTRHSTQWTPPGLTQTATHETLQSASTDTANMFHPHWWESALISDLWSVLKVMSEPRVSQPISPSILSAGELQHVQDPAQCMLPQVIQRGQYSWPCMACTEDWDCHQDLLHVVILVILQLLSHLQQFRNIDGTEIILYGILSKLN